MRLSILTGTALLAACSVLRPYQHVDLPPINIGGTEYAVFMRVESPSSDMTYADALADPNARRAVYAVVDPGRLIYCGETAAPCESLIRRYRAGDVSLSEGGGPM
ncbi:MAG: hypothetical protein KDK12_12060 [Rhodobacteraceae bacterium]|nr:hypothetical protein [Paracoccaceae bacterium]